MIIQTRNMTAAQKKAQDNFKKAIAYRKKTGCTLKQAFAHVKSGKVSGLDKVVKKGSKTIVLYTKKAKKKAAPKKKATQCVLFGIKKKAAKKPSEKAILKKVHSAKTTSKTLFNKLDKLDEAQHKHMGNVSEVDFWLRNFAPRTKRQQLEWYRDIKERLKYDNWNVFLTKQKAIPQLRALEILLNKKATIIK